jgi:hypothetical protein
MVLIMKVIGWMEKLMVMGNHTKQMETYMKENGRMINKKEKGRKFGLMVQYMKGNFIME